jgi:hypothetical protein
MSILPLRQYATCGWTVLSIVEGLLELWPNGERSVGATTLLQSRDNPGNLIQGPKHFLSAALGQQFSEFPDPDVRQHRWVSKNEPHTQLN